MSLQNILAKTDEYLQIPSVIRHEEPFLQHLANDFSSINCNIERRNKILVVSRQNATNPAIITAHIDRHGIILNRQGQFEYAAFGAKKHYAEPVKDAESLFKKIGPRFVNENVFAYDSSGRIISEGKVISSGYDFAKKEISFVIDGMKAEDLKRFVSFGSEIPVSYKSRLELKDGMVSSQIDNVISAAVIYQLIKDGFDGKVIFSTEEEIGRSWKHVADYLSKKEISSKEILNIDTTPYATSDKIQAGMVVLRNKDEHGVFNPELVLRLRKACEEQGIAYEMKDEVIEAENAGITDGSKPKKLGTTELGRIVENTSGNLNGATIQLSTFNYHTNHETTSESALNNYYELIKKLFEILAF